MQAKKRVVKDYENLSEEVINAIKLEYPRGFIKNLITYVNKDGKTISALPYETEEVYYLVRMSESEAKQIILEDDDYENGILRDDFEDDLYNDDDQDFSSEKDPQDFVDTDE